MTHEFNMITRLVGGTQQEKPSTTISCPSCNRRICVELKPPFCETPPSLYYWGFKKFKIEDMLYVHSELIKENKRLNDYVKQLEDRVYGHSH